MSSRKTLHMAELPVSRPYMSAYKNDLIKLSLWLVGTV